ncbi:MAG TPA: hypothetical protein ENN29_03185 [Candidatus Hydrogenedentes bacterium]|nr:hypothetical protein [Candidatus Hydrogenedentota bacterium]
MIRKVIAVFAVVMFFAAAGFAQPEDLPTNDAPPSPPPMMQDAPEGDVVILKSGKELRGVTIARENPIYIEIEFLPGEPPLQLPRTQVASIEYASGKTGRRGEGVLGDVRLVPDIMPGEEVSVEFHQMLMAPMSDEELVFEEADYLVILREFAARFGIVIEVADALQELTPEERQFSRTIPAATTFMNFLRTHLAEIAPEVRVILQYDKLVLQKREDTAPDDAPPPPPADAPAE